MSNIASFCHLRTARVVQYSNVWRLLRPFRQIFGGSASIRGNKNFALVDSEDGNERTEHTMILADQERWRYTDGGRTTRTPNREDPLRHIMMMEVDASYFTAYGSFVYKVSRAHSTSNKRISIQCDGIILSCTKRRATVPQLLVVSGHPQA